MKVVFLLLDSLNRHALSCYNPATKATPAFDRLAEKGVTFDNHYVGSLPCMPARRDLLTGRLNFLHRSWGPVEPFDYCFPTLLQQNGIYSHLISDHYHYWEQGGCGYHNQYSSAEFVRGQERDLWKAMVQPPLERLRAQYHPMLSEVTRRAPNMVNREYVRDEPDYPTVQCIDLGLEFLDSNSNADNWFLQIELFDPHEPFTAPERFRSGLETDYDGPILDWPLYDKLDLTDSEIKELKANYLAVVAMCDSNLGRLLDVFDSNNLWQDTAIVLTSDHGLLLGEQNWWGKNRMPVLDPIARIPLIIYHPEQSSLAGQRRDALTQCIDIPGTILDIFKVPNSRSPSASSHPNDHFGTSLMPTLGSNQKTRDFALYGLYGAALNITDGEHTYFLYPDNDQTELYEYTLMPVHPASYFSKQEFRNAELIHDLAFGNGYPIMKLAALDTAKRPPMQGGNWGDATTALYNLKEDPAQQLPISDTELENHLRSAIKTTLIHNNAPAELYQRFSL